MLVLLLLLISRLINRSGLRISHSKVFSSDYIKSIMYTHIYVLCTKHFGDLFMSDPKFKNKFKARSFSKNSRVKTFNTRLPLTPHIFQIHYHYKQQNFLKISSNFVLFYSERPIQGDDVANKYGLMLDPQTPPCRSVESEATSLIMFCFVFNIIEKNTLN